MVKELQDHGYEAFIVGGSVRDLILGKKCVKGPKGVKAGDVITEDILDGVLSKGQWWQIVLPEEASLMKSLTL